MGRATLDKDPREVASMFDAVARRYDVTNTVLSIAQQWNINRRIEAAAAARRS